MIPLLYFSTINANVGNTTKYHLIEIITGQHSFLSGRTMQPTLDVAYDLVLKQYPTLEASFTRSRIHRPDVLFCTSGEIEGVANQVLDTVDQAVGIPLIINTGSGILLDGEILYISSS